MNSITNQPVPLHWCCDVRPCSGSVLYMEGPVLNQPYWRHPSNNQDATKIQPQAVNLIIVQ